MAPLTQETAHTTHIKLIGFIIVALIGVCGLYAAGFLAYRTWEQRRHSQQVALGMRVFWETWDHLEEHFYGELPSPRKRAYGAIRAMLALLDDPYTTFYEPPPGESYIGIGAEVKRNMMGEVQLFPYTDSPAAKAGVVAGDVLLAINGSEITPTLPLDVVQAQLGENSSTTITLTISRPPTPPFDLKIIHGIVEVPSVVWHTLNQQAAPEIGYLKVNSFNERTGEQVKNALRELLVIHSISSLVLDLRDSDGMDLDAAVAVASQFLFLDGNENENENESDGPVVITVYRDGTEVEIPIAHPLSDVAIRVPLAVLVNRRTAGAAEVVAGALQDYQRAVLIGEHTFGKGNVQQAYHLSDGSLLHITTAICLTPHRRPIHMIGLSPDIAVSSSDDPLIQAIRYLEEETGATQ